MHKCTNAQIPNAIPNTRATIFATLDNLASCLYKPTNDNTNVTDKTSPTFSLSDPVSPKAIAAGICTSRRSPYRYRSCTTKMSTTTTLQCHNVKHYTHSDATKVSNNTHSTQGNTRYTLQSSTLHGVKIWYTPHTPHT